MDHEDSWKLAENATLLFSAVARLTASKALHQQKGLKSVETSKRLFMLGTRLEMIHSILENPTLEEEARVSKRLTKFLTLLEALCTVCAHLHASSSLGLLTGTKSKPGTENSNSSTDSQRRYPNLRSFCISKTDPCALNALGTALGAFATYKRETVERCFSSLDGFALKKRGQQSSGDLRAKLEEQASQVIDPPDRYDSHVNQALFEALCCPCTCSTKPEGLIFSHHWTRLKLHGSVSKWQDKALFNVVFSSRPMPGPDADLKWQQLLFEIPKWVISSFRESTKKKAVGYSGTVSPLVPEQLTLEGRCKALQPGNLCQLLNASFGSVRIRLKIEEGIIHEMYDPAKPEQKIQGRPSTPLRTVLDNGSVTSKDKIILAYIISRSMWQYYNSDFMRMNWTTESIHFMIQQPRRYGHGDKIGIDMSKPYFAFELNEVDDQALAEFCSARHVLHKYPRILALATLLVKLCQPSRFNEGTPAATVQERINNDWNNVQNALDSKKWPHLGFRNPRITETYRHVVSKYLDHTAFHISPVTEGGIGGNLAMEERRAILYKSVVYPLQQLLADSGFLEEIDESSNQGGVDPDADTNVPRVKASKRPRHTGPEHSSERETRQSHMNPPTPAVFATLAAASASNPTQHRPSCNEYTVGWICAVQAERVSACELFDEEYDSPVLCPAHDNNIYDFGLINQHKVVVASLPKGRLGTTSAATVAGDMRRSFPSIKFGLLVGIAGGAPSSRHDIRLGDIVVSSPDKQSGGVVHYDFGKTIQTKEFQRTGSANSPPRLLLNAVQSLSTRHERKGHQIADIAALFVEKNPRLKYKYQRPGPEEDRLYQTAYLHGNDRKSCREACDQGGSKFQKRPDRHESEKDQTAIHYGLIASANNLMKDAEVRDALAEKEGILCFEMEAAGLMDHFPCLVIRGICDYSDTHKNDAWQGYAAVAAAAYAKELLGVIPPAQAQDAQAIS